LFRRHGRQPTVSTIGCWITQWNQPEASRGLLQRQERCGRRLVLSSLATISVIDVHANVHYDGASGHGEIDCLLAAAHRSSSRSSPVRHRLWRRGTEPDLSASQGCPRRSSAQTGKSATTSSRRKRLRPEEEPRPISSCTTSHTPVQIVVSFEGIDPLTISMSALISPSARTVWITDLADFLVVRDSSEIRSISPLRQGAQ